MRVILVAHPLSLMFFQLDLNYVIYINFEKYVAWNFPTNYYKIQNSETLPILKKWVGLT